MGDAGRGAGLTLRTSMVLGGCPQPCPLSAGAIHLEFHSSGNHYVWRKVTSTVHNIIVGKLWIDQVGAYGSEVMAPAWPHLAVALGRGDGEALPSWGGCWCPHLTPTTIGSCASVQGWGEASQSSSWFFPRPAAPWGRVGDGFDPMGLPGVAGWWLQLVLICTCTTTNA